ncbi:MFS transporter [Pantanalinema sp. GBBB05]|uniref:MFS transporter n=1 Tax=Pantanalinema sp. GBBB05 TaxID=2604139 RepID=UPI001DF5F6D9|nr:SLC45 family MFS transporter [Pantanalinema sp. GBBB05]
MIDADVSRSPVVWAKVCGLATVQGAIGLMWVIYNLYLPSLLKQLGFPPQLSIGLLIVENILAIALEPIMGGLSDRARIWVGSRFPLIILGVVLSAASFILIPAVMVIGNTTAVLHWLLPVVMVIWAIAMTIFRSPALALLGQYAFESRLPQAASILMLMGALAGAIGVFAAPSKLILSLGPTMAFAIGSIVALLTAMLLRLLDAQSPNPLSAAPAAAPLVQSIRSLLPALGRIFGAGVGIALGSRLLNTLLNQVQPSPGSLTGVFSLALLLATLPAGWLAVKIGNRSAMLTGFSILAGLLGLMTLVESLRSQVGMTLLLGIAFSPINNGTIPFAFSLVPPDRGGLGVGVFFGGSALAATLFGMAINQFGSVTPLPATLGGILAFLIAGLCVYSRRWQPELKEYK